MRYTVNNFGLCILEDLNYELLVHMVKERVCLADNQELLLSFQHPHERYVMNIVNDSDVSMLKWVINDSKKSVHLYTVVSAPEVQEVVIPSSRKDSNNAVSGSGTFKK